MSDVMKGMILVLMILYIVSPIDACLGPIDDLIVLFIGIAARKRHLGCRRVKEEDKMDVCECCGRSLAEGVITLPWEDGDNEYAYVTCPHCGAENTQYGFGEDDD